MFHSHPEPPMNNFERRSFVKMGAVQLFGLLGYGDVLRLRAQSPAPAKRDISIIHLWLTGGLSQLDTFDPKPDIDSRYRSLFKPIESPTSTSAFPACRTGGRLTKRHAP